MAPLDWPSAPTPGFEKWCGPHHLRGAGGTTRLAIGADAGFREVVRAAPPAWCRWHSSTGHGADDGPWRVVRAAPLVRGAGGITRQALGAGAELR
ncbi:hypothetical protein [Pseudomonas putida]|uniref:hypothetical protein n=1 Tax=Pseudomonas putida TaxID=303 RepID=UPI0037C9F2CF